MYDNKGDFPSTGPPNLCERNDIHAPIEIVEYYLNNGSLRNTAKKFNIHYNTLWKWVKIYKEIENEGGVHTKVNKSDSKREKLLTGYRRPWNRTEKEIEERVVFLKEKDPTLTVRKAKEILEKQGIKMSIKGIWGIWKRYGYAGFKKEKFRDDFTEYYPWVKSAKIKFKIAEGFFEKGKLAECAEVLNSIPCLPKNDLIEKIPTNLLNLRRRIEKINSLFGKININSYIEQVEDLYQECLKRGLDYSALRLGLIEVMALDWLGKPEDGLKKIEELKNFIKKRGNYYSYLLFEPRFSLLIEQAIFNAYLSKINTAQKITNLCKNTLRKRKVISPYFIIDLGILYSHLYDFQSAEYWYLKALDQVDEETKKQLIYYLSIVLLNKGEYKKAKRISKDAYLGYWSYDSLKFLFYSILSLLRGNPEKSIDFSNKAIYALQEQELGICVFNSYFTKSCAYLSIGEKKKALQLLKNGLDFFRAKRIKKYIDIFENLLAPEKMIKKDSVLPTLRVLLLLKKGDYFGALSFAKKKGIMSYFYRYIFFFPDLVLSLLEKGRKTNLPISILRLPIFNKDVFSYEINFLGKLRVYKIKGDHSDEKIYIRQKLSPKDSAFLIHLSLRASVPGKEIPLVKIYKNFWPSNDEKRARRNLSHLLLRIKKSLKIPSHLIEISYAKDNPVLINKGVYFITDYTEFKQTVANANTFLRTGDWEYAKKEFLKAFSLMRGEPFKKMYDDWSEDIRTKILNKYEEELLRFAGEYLTRSDLNDPNHRLKEMKKIKKILTKANLILKYSYELKQMLKNLGIS